MRQWATEWIDTLRIAPPFSRRRRELLHAMAEHSETHPSRLEVRSGRIRLRGPDEWVRR